MIRSIFFTLCICITTLSMQAQCDASVFVVGSQTICPGSATSFNMIFSGTAPWTFTYTRNGVPQAPVTTSEFQYIWMLTEPGTYALTSVVDADCVGTDTGIATGQVFVDERDPPTATLIDDTSVCPGDPSDGLQVNLTGFGPWDVSYTIDGGAVIVDEVLQSPGAIYVTESGIYELVEVSDFSCTGPAAGSINLDVAGVTTASLTLSGQVVDTLLACSDDGVNENWLFGISGATGAEQGFVITDRDSLVTSIISINTVSVEGSAADTLLLWYITYDEGLVGLAVGNSIADGLTGCYGLSDPIAIVLQSGNDCTTDVYDYDLLSSLLIYPNPVVDILHVEYALIEAAQVDVMIVDSQGRLVLHEQRLLSNNEAQFSLDMSELKPGIYSLIMQDGQGKVSRSLISR